MKDSHTLWHARTIPEALQKLAASYDGLSSQEAAERLDRHGRNELRGDGGTTLWSLVVEQLRSVMILILIVAGIVAWVVKGDGGVPVDAIAIFAIVALFVALGVFQEYRAQQAIAALKKMAAPTVKVYRDGRVVEIPAPEVVPGDVVRLEAGSVVPADARLLESVGLKTQEAALTGESESVEKLTGTVAGGQELALGDRRNMVYAGTFATAGRGTAVVVSTGMQTELGKIASMLQGTKVEKTPLQKRLDQLGKSLAIIAVVIALLVALIGVFFEGKAWADVIIMGISIAVAIVPEGLPAVLTVTLALGAQRMLKRRALIRRLPAVETLGSVTVICSDKTGTLTQNKMTASSLVSSCGRKAQLRAVGFDQDATSSEAFRSLVSCGALCNDTSENETNLVGDPTETALVSLAHGFDLRKAQLEAALPRSAEIGFTSERKLMTTVHTVSGHPPPWVRTLIGDEPSLVITKGAADRLVELCSAKLVGDEKQPWHHRDKLRVEADILELTKRGMRVLAVAVKGAKNGDPIDEANLTLLGLIGMIDPPREEAKEAIARCKTAGIRVMMITGDHPITARAIATELGFASSESRVVTGAELEEMSTAALRQVLPEVSVFARVSPEHKLKIVEALQAAGHVVAMTGDGVNDAPALKKADIGVAMGTGTDVAKEAADMVLTDDNFATIVNAVEEGRTVYDNLRRFVMFSVAGNLAKVMTVAVAPLIGLRAMLTPIQVLFSNLLTDGLVGLGLGVEQAERDVMRRPPVDPKEGVLAGAIGRHVAVVGSMIGVLMLALGWVTWPGEANADALAVWGTTMFTTLAFIQIARAWSSRSFRSSAWSHGFASNKTLLAMAILAVTAQLVVVYTPGAQKFFGTVALAVQQLGIALTAALAVLILMEVLKRLERGGDAKSAQRGDARHDSNVPFIAEPTSFPHSGTGAGLKV